MSTALPSSTRLFVARAMFGRPPANINIEPLSREQIARGIAQGHIETVIGFDVEGRPGMFYALTLAGHASAIENMSA